MFALYEKSDNSWTGPGGIYKYADRMTIIAFQNHCPHIIGTCSGGKYLAEGPCLAAVSVIVHNKTSV